jgi:DeoR family transcriptional regulator of aga operon
VTTTPEIASARSAKRLAYKVEIRSTRILNELAGGKELSVEELILRSGVSATTLRRDLRRLERQGMVRRAHGVVALAGPPGLDLFFDDPGFREQVRHMAVEKRRIGAAAAALVSDGATIALAAGTTAAQMSRPLRSRTGLTIVTNALNIAMDFSRQKQSFVHLTGGYLSGDWFALVGPKALELISSIFTEQFFFGANGVDPEHGVTDRHPEEAAVNQALARQAKRRILLVDHSKFGHTARYQVCGTGDLTTIITDSGVSDETILPFQRRGVEVIRV